MGNLWSRHATTADLLTAVKRGDVKRVCSLLKDTDSTPVDTVEDLQALGVTSAGEVCDVNGCDDDGNTVLMNAMRLVQSADDAHSEILKLLLAHPRCDVNKRNRLGKAALHLACDDIDARTQLTKPSISHPRRMQMTVFTAVLSIFIVSFDALIYFRAQTGYLIKIGAIGLKFFHICRCLAFIAKEIQSALCEYMATSRRHSTSAKPRAALHLLLSEARCDVNLRDNTGNTALTNIIWRVESEGDSYYEAAEALLKHQELDVNKTNLLGETVLHTVGLHNIKSHICFQLLLGHTRCDINKARNDGATALMLAAARVKSPTDAYAQCLRMFLGKSQLNVNQQNKRGHSALQYACIATSVESDVAVKILLADQRCDVNLQNNVGDTALINIISRAVWGNRYYEAAKALLSHPHVDVNIANKQGHTALHKACSTDIQSYIGVYLLLSHPRCDVNKPDSNGVTALMFCANLVKSNTDMYALCVRALLNHAQIDVNAQHAEGGTALHVACSKGKQPDVASLLLLSDERCDVNLQDSDGNTALMNIIWRIESEGDKYYKAAEALLNHPHVDVNRTNKHEQTALHKCCLRKVSSHLGAQLLLRDPSCDVNKPNDEGVTALMFCSMFVSSRDDAHAQCMMALLKHSQVDINVQSSKGSTALHIACNEGAQPDVAVELLLSDERCDVNAQNNDGNTPLIHLVQNVEKHNDKFAQAMKLILSQPGVEINKLNFDHTSALHRACTEGTKSHIGAHLLLSNPACDVNLQCVDCEQSALILAAENVQRVGDPYYKIMRLLLQHEEIDVNKMDGENLSVLYTFGNSIKSVPQFSSREDDICILQMLLSHGADPNLPRCLLREAASKLSTDMFEVLLKFGADPNSAWVSYPKKQPDCKSLYSERFKKSTDCAIHHACREDFAAKVSLLLKHEADPSATWKGLTVLETAIVYSSSEAILTQLSEHVSWQEVLAALEKCSFLTESPYDCAVRLDVIAWIERLKQDSAGSEDKQINSEKKDTHQRLPRKLTVHVLLASQTDAIEFVKRCQSDLISNQNETSRITEEVTELMNEVAKLMTENFPHLSFTAHLSGSMSEGTKCHRPDEYDFICLLHTNNRRTDPYDDIDERYAMFESHSGTLDVVRLLSAFYYALDWVFHELASVYGTQYGHISLHKQTVLLCDGISKLQLLWDGAYFKKMVIHVDVAVGMELKYEYNKRLPLGVQSTGFYRVDKSPRNYEYSRAKKLHFPVSFSRIENAIFKEVTSDGRNGYVLAKACRFAIIARPADDLTSYGLQEAINVDDFITSYMLKTCFIKLLPRDARAVERDSACGWAIRIYKRLETDLRTKKVSAWYDEYPRLIDCVLCKVERGCCKKRLLILAMTSQILCWLRQHRDELGDIQFLDTSNSASLDPPQLVCDRDDAAIGRHCKRQ